MDGALSVTVRGSSVAAKSVQQCVRLLCSGVRLSDMEMQQVRLLALRAGRLRAGRLRADDGTRRAAAADTAPGRVYQELGEYNEAVTMFFKSLARGTRRPRRASRASRAALRGPREEASVAAEGSDDDAHAEDVVPPAPAALKLPVAAQQALLA
ncbi:MAG: hypothetical protein ACK4QW_19560, partial [Alphaproteobacteria bacterium]